jgi:GntR family colanic acid and biofilm gene transcriptional regulator
MQIENKSLSSQIVREIRSAIMLGDLAPGARLTFRDVAERLNASVTPVREALLQLVAARVLTAGPGRTITVPSLTRVQFLELRVIRVLIEGFVAELAARHADAALADNLEEIHALVNRAKREQDTRAAIQHNQSFHFALYEASGMPALIDMIENIWLRTGPYNRYIYADPANHIFDIPDPAGAGQQHDHSLVIMGLREGRPDVVRAAIESDIAAGDAIILRRLPDAPPGSMQKLAERVPTSAVVQAFLRGAV